MDHRLAFDSIGDGFPLVFLHGAYSTRDELRSAVEPVFDGLTGYRRLHVDLPGHGESTTEPSDSCADALDRIDALLEAEVGAAPFAVVGHSFGGHLARGLAARHPDRALGVALICPMRPDAMAPEPHEVVRTEGDPYALVPDDLVDEYRGYFVVHTPETARRFTEAVVPSIGRFDGEAVERMMNDWQVPTEPFDGEVLVLAGRHDAFVGFRGQFDLVDRHPNTTFLLASGAGHALPHERPDLVAAALRDWLDRLPPG